MDIREALARHADFSSLAAEDRDVLARAFTVEEHPTGHAFVTEGSRAGAAWMILDGEVAVTRDRDPYIDELVRLGPGEMFGLASLVSGVRRTASCRAAGGPVVSARLEKFALDELMRDSAPIALALQRAVMRQLASDYRRVAENLREMIQKRG